jgi:hypothetical protein
MLALTLAGRRLSAPLPATHGMSDMPWAFS